MQYWKNDYFLCPTFHHYEKIPDRNNSTEEGFVLLMSSVYYGRNLVKHNNSCQGKDGREKDGDENKREKGEKKRATGRRKEGGCK